MINRNKFHENPFQITTPEGLTAEETVSLFVDVFTDLPRVTDQGHVLMAGPRGVGKSMMLRYLQSDCQCLVRGCDFSDLPFIGVYIPIKNFSFIKSELRRLDDRHASEIINEHLMISHISMIILNSLKENELALKSLDCQSLVDFYNNSFLVLSNNEFDEKKSYFGEDRLKFNRSIIGHMSRRMQKSYNNTKRYIQKLALTNELHYYEGNLFDYQDFLLPLITELKNVDGFPNASMYLLIDDAHCLTEIQTRVLNSWISTRTSTKISLKVSTQYNYKSYYTVTGATIDTPHDYSEIDLATIYTGSSKSKYRDRIKSIIEKRLALSEIESSAELFFPEDLEQERKISIISDEYKKKHDEGNGRGYNRSDDALRNARPDYIASLAGNSKSSSTYNYAGFNQLVHISSGVVRYFLESAHSMYSIEKLKQQDNKPINFISPSVQNEVVREEANKYLFFELDNFRSEENRESYNNEEIEKLSNLIQGLGGLFRRILLSKRSERRIFSVAISDEVSIEVERILRVGLEFGYFHRSTIGRKNSKNGGRTKLYVMNRRLAPIWTLDPTGFAGYLFVKNSVIEEGLVSPQKMLNRITSEIGDDKEFELVQFNLFGDDGLFEFGD